MKFSEQWLREWVNPPISSETLIEQLTMAGLEVDSVTPVAPEFSGVVVAEVIDVLPHPDADKLRICKTNDGNGILDIVCGAANARPGLRVPLARVGAKLPGPVVIRRAKLRGVPSFGMLCSEMELGLADSADGLMELPADAPVGEDIRVWMKLDDTAIDVDLTPNRGDCLGIAGVAREVGMLNDYGSAMPVLESVVPGTDDTLAIVVEEPEACPRYTGRVILGIEPAAATPVWMQEYLRRSGLRSINAVVDITNYIMFELGQPMHAFDLDLINDGIQVRFAAPKESILLLDGQNIELADDTLVIADRTRAIAVAGIMGGKETAVGSVTRNIFLESAFFSQSVMTGKARRYKTHTDSSHRFERGVDFELQEKAIDRASRLIIDICGGTAGPVIDQFSSACLPDRSPILLRKARIVRMLGIEIPDDVIQAGLARLGMQIEPCIDGWMVTPPSFRFDLSIESDLVEEVARIKGYDSIPSFAPKGGLNIHERSEGVVALSRIRDMLVARGYHEAITYGFVDTDLQEKLDPGSKPIPLANPISRELSVMRASLLPGLANALIYNMNRQQERIRLFEIGQVFVRKGEDLRQESRIGGIISGAVAPMQWGIPDRQSDFFDIKSDVEALLGLTGQGENFSFSALDNRSFHPGQAASLSLGKEHTGKLGALHPALSRDLGLEQPVFMFELSLDAITRANLPEFCPLSRFPLVRRDISVLLDQNVSAAALMDCVMKDSPDILKNLQLFDVYMGEGIDSGKKSVALGLIFQGTSSTLVDTDVESLMEDIRVRLVEALGATLR